MEYYSDIKNKLNKFLPFATMWMDLEGMILKCQTEKDKYQMISLICGVYKIKQNENRLIDTENKEMVVRGEGDRALGEIGKED